MKELTFVIEDLSYDNTELEKYLLSLNGVIDIKIDNKKDEIYIKYNSKVISINLIILELKTFLKILKKPTIIKFNKICNKKKNKIFIIVDSCCEYCLKGFIEDLILLDGIESISVEFNCISYFKTPISIGYNKELFNEEEINKIIDKYFK